MSEAFTVQAEGSSGTQLRIGLLVDSLDQPRWVHKVIADIQGSGFATIALIVTHGRSGRTRAEMLRTLVRNRRHLLYEAHRRLDDRLGRSPTDAFERTSISELVSDSTVIEAKESGASDGKVVQPPDLDAVLEHELDVALAFDFGRIRGTTLQIARFGVWTYDNYDADGCPSGFWEVMEGEPVTQSVLRKLSGDPEGGQVLYRSYSATQSKSVRRSRNANAWKSSEFVIRKLQALHEDGPAALGVESGTAAKADSPKAARGKPGNLRMLTLMGGLAGRYLRQRTTRSWHSEQWRVGFRFRQEGDGPGPATE